MEPGLVRGLSGDAVLHGIAVPVHRSGGSVLALWDRVQVGCHFGSSSNAFSCLGYGSTVEVARAVAGVDGGGGVAICI